MKTTVDIADSLLLRAKAVARQEGRTLRALFEEGLRAVLEERRRGKAFQLDDQSFGGNGLQAGFAYERWDDILEASYRGRGA